MLMLGIVGEYMWRNLDETRRRPRFVIETIIEHEPAENENDTAENRIVTGQQ